MKDAEKIKLLIAEDDQDCRELLAEIIPRRFRQIVVETAANGKIALELFRKQRHDLLLTDVNMPEMNGIQLAQRVRELKPETGIIVITADTGKALLEKTGRGLEIDHYIYKPLQYKKLFEAIEHSLLRLS